LLIRGQTARAYNVGSDHEVTIRELANEVANCANQNAKVIIYGINTPENVNRYVPSVEKIFKELGISQSVSLQRALLQTSEWLKETRDD